MNVAEERLLEECAVLPRKERVLFHSVSSESLKIHAFILHRSYFTPITLVVEYTNYISLLKLNFKCRNYGFEHECFDEKVIGVRWLMLEFGDDVHLQKVMH